ncbi:MAG: DNA polymerase III subunit beta [Mesorhizobium sp.]
MANSSSTIVIGREALLPAMTTVQRAVERRNTIPILANVMISAEAGQLTLTATDLDMEITTRRTCQLAGPAVTVTLPAGNLHDIVRKLPEGCEVQLSGDEQTWTIAAARSKFRLPCLPASDFPSMSRADMPASFRLPAETLARMIDTVRFAISTEETRYYLNGIHWHRDAESDLLVAVTTDGHRLARVAVATPEGAAELPPVIVPRKTTEVVTKILPAKGDVAIEVSQTRISFALDDGTTLISKLIDGTYPDYRRVVPQGNPNRFLVDRAALAAAVDRVITISAGRDSSVKFGFGDGELLLTTNNPEAGSGEDGMAVVMQAGAPVEIGFNGRYCLDLLAACTSENVIFELGDAGSPARLVPAVDDANSPYFVLMPMRVS